MVETSQFSWHTVDGSEIRRENQLRLAVYPINLQGFGTHPRWLFGISEPSKVYPIIHQILVAWYPAFPWSFQHPFTLHLTSMICWEHMHLVQWWLWLDQFLLQIQAKQLNGMGPVISTAHRRDSMVISKKVCHLKNAISIFIIFSFFIYSILNGICHHLKDVCKRTKSMIRL